MKMTALFLTAFAITVTSTAFAAVEPRISRGSVETYTLSGAQDQSIIVIKGQAAEKLFNDLSDDLLGNIDSVENNGVGTVMKNGENITCYLHTSVSGKRKYSCEISINKKESGKIGPAAVG